MFKRGFSLVLGLLLVLGTVSLASALGDGNYRKGKYLFRKNCRSCHAEGQKAKDLSPLDKTQAEWVKAFSAEAVAGYPCKDEWAKLSDTDKNDIFTYLHKHAKDSPTPAKCK